MMFSLDHTVPLLDQRLTRTFHLSSSCTIFCLGQESNPQTTALNAELLGTNKYMSVYNVTEDYAIARYLVHTVNGYQAVSNDYRGLLSWPASVSFTQSKCCKRIQQIAYRINISHMRLRLVDMCEQLVHRQGDVHDRAGQVRVEPLQERTDQVAEEKQLSLVVNLDGQLVFYKPANEILTCYSSCTYAMWRTIRIIIIRLWSEVSCWTPSKSDSTNFL